MPRVKGQDRRATLLEKQKQIANQLAAIDAKAREQARKDDTRRKVIAGALILEHMEANPRTAIAQTMRELLVQYVDPKARHLFPFLEGATAPVLVASEERAAAE